MITSNIQPQNENKKEDKFLFYCVIEVFEYETSQRDIVYGLRNPKEDFINICSDFNIEYKNDCHYINYSIAKKIELSSFMIWGTEKSLNIFLRENKIEKEFNDFIVNNYKKKAGIYLCVNITKNIGYLIIWPGKFSYQYSKINEPNSNILLTLVRYGFSISKNSILCLSNNEIETLEFNGYKIFQIKDSVYKTQRGRIEFNENKEKSFKIGNINYLEDIKDIKELFKNKNLVGLKTNQNCLLFYEEQTDKIETEEIDKMNLNEFIEKESNIDIIFEECFNIPLEQFYLLIKKNNFFIQNSKNEECYTEQQIRDILEKKIDEMIKDLFKSLYVDLLNEENFNNNIKCVICRKTKNETKEDFYYNEDNNNINYYHISCSKKKYKIIDNNSIEYIKFKIYDKCKNKIEGKAIKNYDEIIKNKIKSFFRNCESNFQCLNTNKFVNIYNYYFNKINPLKIDNEIILKQIKSLKTELFGIFNREKEKRKLIKKEIEIFKNNSNDKKKQNEWIKNWKKKINQYYIDNKNNINKWIILKSIFKSKNNFFLKYIKKK